LPPLLIAEVDAPSSVLIEPPLVSFHRMR